ncbi:type I polyketide synthase [Actinomadura sp. WMMB 499]|uniref:type I polyketide synthase n=1 Tax=Actinomadura sp. WMMB 499 TaxID=1219491 RepID=UPI0012475330|nr:type I polyketide synthase [Actinomadura sp. WMMB 499]QFG20242.1 SDR family NAD(P)-dependent oxidoreductase [Actinomadura sp. WMMB 499]
MPEDALGQVVPALASWRSGLRERAVVDGWRYRVAWSALRADGAAAPVGVWAVRAEEDDALAVALTTALVRRGVDARIVPPGEEIDAETTGGILSLPALDDAPLRDGHAVPRGLADTLRLVQGPAPARVWCLTQGAVGTGPDAPPARPLQAHVWGLGRVAALEHPARWGGLVDLPAAPDERTWDQLCQALANTSGEDQMALRPAGVLARRIVRAPLAGRPSRRTWTPRGTTLVTGGTGALGRPLALALAERGAEHLVLVGRRGPDAPGAAALAERLRALGARVTIAGCDVTSREALSAVLAAIPADAPLSSVFHLAGVVDHQPLDEITTDRLDAVIRSKTTGAALLDELTRDLDLSAFVLFSSNAGTWGSGGQAAYASANAYLDALAEARRARGRTATSVSWGAWGETGLAAEDDVADYLRRRGQLPMAPESARTALWQALDHDETAVCVANVEWETYAAAFTAARPSPLISDLPDVRGADPVANTDAIAAPGAAEELRARLTPLPEADRLAELTALVRSHASAALGHGAADAVEPDLPFKDVGFDSLIAVDLRNRLTAATGVRLPATLAFDHPTPRAVAELLRTELVADGAPTEASLLAGLDRLDADLAELDPGDAIRRKVAGRLQVLLAKWGEGNGRGDASDHHRDLASASADEVLELIHEELGKS